MNSLMLLSLVVLRECGDICHVSTARDCKTVASRIEHEGVSFLTLTLPQFAKDFERSLDAYWGVTHDVFKAFAFDGGLPRFLGGFLELVFDRATGRLLDDPDPEAIRAVRQICLLHSKLKLECTPSRKRAAFEGFVETEAQLRLSDAARTEQMEDDFVYYGQLLFRDTFQNMEEFLFNGGYVVPRHGPGKTADRLSGNAKWENRRWSERLERVFPAREYMLPSYRFSEEFDTFSWDNPEDEPPVRVTDVLKTLKAPRLIAIEPTCKQYLQQGLARLFLENFVKHDYLMEFIGLDNQLPNQELARIGSITGTLATLDLSEASDRVSNQHVQLLFLRHSLLAEAVDAVRSRKADVPNHGIISLAKYASMGSGLTFPMEVMVFLIMIFRGIGVALGHRLTEKDIKLLIGQVRAFGDDLIVPKWCVLEVIESLESFGYKVNSSKSFWNGSFRESCGKEYYDGYDVTVVKNRRVLPTSLADAPEIESIVAMRNLFYLRGMWSTARWLDSRIRKLIPFPIVRSTSVGLGRTSFLPHYRFAAYVKDVTGQQRPLVRAAVSRSTPPASPVDGVAALLKWFLKEGEDPFMLGSYERQGRPDTAYIKVRGTQPF